MNENMAEQLKDPLEITSEATPNANNSPKYIIWTIWGMKAFIFFFLKYADSWVEAIDWNLTISQDSVLFAFTKRIEGKT